MTHSPNEGSAAPHRGSVTLKDRAIRLAARIFVPEWAKQMDEEGLFELRAAIDAEADESQYLIVEDNRSDMTVFVFSGLDGLFGAGPRFEFRRMFRELGLVCNLVFVRELRGLFYHVAPNGTRNGLDFYAERLNRIKASLGASTNLAMGFSAGGSAAFYFGARCNMDGVLAFSPSFPFGVYTSGRAILRHALNFRKMICGLPSYLEISSVTIWGLIAQHRTYRTMGLDGVWDVSEAYRAACPRPQATVVFGRTAQQDSAQARALAGFDEVTLAPVATGFHNVPGVLKKRNQLGPFIVEQLTNLSQRAGQSRGAAASRRVS